jgi:predicted ester cyclase
MSDEELINHIFFFEKIFPKYELFADELYGEDDKVIVKARVTGIHKGDFQGFAPTNKKVIIPFIIIYTIQSGKISDYYMVSDQYSLMQQLEMVPA